MGIIAYFHEDITFGLISGAETLALNGMDWLGPVFRSLVIIYLAVWGYLLWTGISEEPLRDSLIKFLRISVVSTFALGTAFYSGHIIELAFNGPGEIVAAISGTPVDAIHQIDQVWIEMRKKADEAMLSGGLTNLVPYIVGGLLIAATFIFCVPVFLLITMSQIMTAVLIVVGPFFIAAALFKRGVPALGQWVNQLLTYFMIYVLAMVLMHLAIETVIELMRTGISTRSPDLGIASEIVFISLMMLYAITLIPTMGGALAGSMSAPVEGAARKALGMPSGGARRLGDHAQFKRRERYKQRQSQRRQGSNTNANNSSGSRKGAAVWRTMNPNRVEVRK